MKSKRFSWLKQLSWSKIIGWLKQAGVYLLLFIVMSMAVDWWRGKDFPKTQIPALSGTSVQGEEFDINELSKDQAVIVYYWASWCSVCTFVSPAVNTLSEYYPVLTVALSSGEDKRIKKYLQIKEYDFAVINDNNSELGKDWQVKVTPTIFIVKDGEVKSFTTGFTSLPGLWWRLITA